MFMVGGRLERWLAKRDYPTKGGVIRKKMERPTDAMVARGRLERRLAKRDYPTKGGVIRKKWNALQTQW